jgi:hypothetical protein
MVLLLYSTLGIGFNLIVSDHVNDCAKLQQFPIKCTTFRNSPQYYQTVFYNLFLWLNQSQTAARFSFFHNAWQC